jgi:hypothetical protein
MEGVDDTKDFYRLQGRLRQLRDITNIRLYIDERIKDFEKQEYLENLKKGVKDGRTSKPYTGWKQ